MSRSLIFLHQYFAPELAGSAQQLTDLVLGLSEQGYSIQVVTGQPSYSSKKKLPAKEDFQGVQVNRLPKLQLSRNNPLGRILSAVSFFIAAFFKIFFMNSRALLVIGSDPPFLSLIGWFFKGIRGQRYVLIVSDVYPEVAMALGELNPKGWMAWILEASNRLAYAKAEKIVVLGENMAEHLQKKLQKSDDLDKIQVIHNWADGDTIRPIEKSNNRFSVKHGLLDRLIVLFSGNMGKIYNFEDVLQAARHLDDDPSIEFLFIGDGPLRNTLENRIATEKLKNIRFLPYQLPEELPFSLTCGDLALVPLKEQAVGLCVPGKIYYALAGGLPLLTIAPENSELARIVRDHDCGWNVPPGDAQSLADLLRALSKNRALLADKKKKARRCFETHFTRQRAIQEYDSLFCSLEKDS